MECLPHVRSCSLLLVIIFQERYQNENCLKSTVISSERVVCNRMAHTAACINLWGASIAYFCCPARTRLDSDCPDELVPRILHYKSFRLCTRTVQTVLLLDLFCNDQIKCLSMKIQCRMISTILTTHMTAFNTFPKLPVTALPQRITATASLPLSRLHPASFRFPQVLMSQLCTKFQRSNIPSFHVSKYNSTFHQFLHNFDKNLCSSASFVQLHFIPCRNREGPYQKKYSTLPHERIVSMRFYFSILQ